MTSYNTATEAIADLKLRGFTIDFNSKYDHLICDNLKACLKPDEFKIVEMHRFDGVSNPEDENVVYAIESKDGKLHGTLSMALGTIENQLEDALLKKLNFHHNP